jgi:hypothetical protein
VGEKLQLRVRVYNFSLADMPPGTLVHTQFYGQVYEHAQLVGNSFLIGEDCISPIPGFKSASRSEATPMGTIYVCITARAG